ncbi:hypothetical protein ACFQMA_22620 [Halosimplex aquaticum]|uniref:Uncharacterized protein n=1 Tax=Halosimplex aquaticum TaxID=3026162 RepID=A0ABD5YE45_9EURY|nr:hypothetical protein [Halosimplex aquaticum]
MPANRYQPLLQLVHSRAGDAFRGAIRYYADDWSVLYLRDDVATERLRDSLDTIVGRARAAESIVPDEAYDRLGETQAAVELHDRAVLLHFREAPTEGILVSLDRDVAQALGQFVNSCNAVLDERGGADGSND